MSHNYDNWERLVRAVLLREELIEIALRDSRDPSSISYGSCPSNYDLSVGSNSSFSVQADEEKRDQSLRMDYSDLTLNHTDWKALLPPGENEVVWRSASLSFSLDKRTGKNCFMVGPRGLVIPHADHEFISYSQSRFSEVAEIRFNSLRTYILCRIQTQRLSPDTIYGAYLVFKLETLLSPCDDESDDHFFLSDLHKELHLLNLFLEYADATISLLEVDEMQGHEGVLKKIVTSRERNVVDRGNGWKELEIGSFSVEGKKRGEVIAQFNKQMFMEDRSKGLRPIVEGIEFRPTYRRFQSFGSFRLKTRKGKGKKSLVIRVQVDSDEEKKKVMEAVSTLAGVDYMYMNMMEMEVTVVGDVDTKQVLSKLRKSWHTEFLFGSSTCPTLLVTHFD